MKYQHLVLRTGAIVILCSFILHKIDFVLHNMQMSFLSCVQDLRCAHLLPRE